MKVSDENLLDKDRVPALFSNTLHLKLPAVLSVLDG